MRLIIIRSLLITVSLLGAVWILINRNPVSLNMGPFGYSADIPLSLLLMAVLGAGFGAGWAFSRIGTVRRAIRRGLPTNFANSDQYQMTIQTQHELVDWMVTFNPQGKRRFNGRR